MWVLDQGNRLNNIKFYFNAGQRVFFKVGRWGIGKRMLVEEPALKSLS